MMVRAAAVPLVEARDVSFRYSRSDPPVLDGLDLCPRRGVITALTGPSGRGKSTALFLLGLLLRPSTGTILVDGLDTRGLRDRDLSRLRAGMIGFVFQDAALDPTSTILDNVVESCDYGSAPRRPSRHRARELLDEMGVVLPPGRRPLQISGGQAQRVAVCRALLPRPAVILADEPTGNLDEDSADAVLGRLRREADRGAVVVVATHDSRVLARCDERVEL